MIDIKNLSFSYKTDKALDDISLSIQEGEIFSLLGPNGSGKTTLFRILSTMLEISSGEVTISGHSFKNDYAKIREKIGIVFQSPSLDPKLTVEENIKYQGALYGLSSVEIKTRTEVLLEQFQLKDRASERVEKLSGGLKRRVELAKALLHQPKILLLDEPSTGLDPGVRFDFWQLIRKLNEQEKMTILVTTHLTEEAEDSHRVAVLDRGKLVRLGTPEELKREVKKDVVVVKCRGTARRARTVADHVQNQLNISVSEIDGTLQIEHDEGASLVPKLVEAFPGEIESVIYRKPTLEDVFMHHTGHPFWQKTEARA